MYPAGKRVGSSNFNPQDMWNCGCQMGELYYWPINVALYRAFSHDVTAAILVFQNNKTAAMLVYQTNPVGVELFSYVNASFCFNKFA